MWVGVGVYSIVCRSVDGDTPTKAVRDGFGYSIAVSAAAMSGQTHADQYRLRVNSTFLN